MNHKGKCFLNQPTLVNTGGPDDSLLYREDSGLCTCGVADNTRGQDEFEENV